MASGQQTPASTIRRIQILRQTQSVRQTARQLEVSTETVQKYSRPPEETPEQPKGEDDERA